MIIPVRCFACGKVLADKWDAYERRCRDSDEADKEKDKDRAEGGTEEAPPGQKTARGLILDELGIERVCCRMVMLTHVDISRVM
jgi:DNA-directed RNA polymerase subunit N